MKHIESKIINRTIENIKKHNLLNINDTVVIGVSGGADSVVLLDVLYKISTIHNYNLNIKVAHINHQIRNTATRDQLFVKDLCQKYNIEFFCKSINVEAYGKKNKISCEEAGRKIRYKFFQELAQKNGKIATAHNANDNVETLLMRLFRGTGLKGLCGISYKNNNIIRPLLNVSRKEIEEYIAECELTHITDETNLLPIYTRNKIRLNVVPMIEKDFNANFCTTINNSIQSFNQDMDFITEQAKKSYKEVCAANNDMVCIDVKKFFSLHNAIKNRVIAMAIEDVKKDSVNISAQNIEDIISLFYKNNNNSIDIANNIIAIRRYDTVDIQIKKEKIISQENIVVSEHIGEIIIINEKYIKIEIVEEKDVVNNEKIIHIPFERLPFLSFRNKQTGDHYKKTDNMTCSLRKHLSNLKIKTEERKEKLFLYDEDFAVWIIDYSAMRLSNRTGKFIKFSVV